ncbi:MAG: hypothetical protein ACK5NL_14850, partial [Vibrio fluvialis]
SIDFDYCLDTDGDGLVNSIDLDSDNDGCPDAIEGAENVTNSMLTSANGTLRGGNGVDPATPPASGTYNQSVLSNLGNTIDAQGVPTIVNKNGVADTDTIQGQGKGHSQDALLNSCKNYWIGTTDTIWDLTNNWTAKEIPFTGQDVEFATNSNNDNKPAVNDLYVPSGGTKTIGSLINESTKALVIPAGTGLVVGDTVIGSSSMSEAGKLQVQASSNDTIPNGTLIVTTGCTQPAIYGTVQLNGKGGPDTGSWVDNIVGSPTYGATLTYSYHWQHFGIPVLAMVPSPALDGSYVRKYHEPWNGQLKDVNGSLVDSYYRKWEDLTNTSPMIAFEGYSITQDSLPAIYSMQGILLFCDANLVMTREAAETAGTDALNKRYGLGQNIFGNSYTAAIKIDKMIFPADNTIEQTVYLYNTGTFGQWTDGTIGDGVRTAGSYMSIPVL